MRHEFREIELAAKLVKGTLQHGGGRAHGVVPIHFAEHDVAGKDHHFGGGLALVGDGQGVAGFVEAEAADEPAAVEVLAVGNAGVEAVAHQIVDFVDIDRAGKDAAEDAVGRSRHIAADKVGDVQRVEPPIVAQHVGHLARGDFARGERLVIGKLGRPRSSIGWPNGQWPIS